MNRAVALALTLVCLPLMAGPDLTSAAWAEVSEKPADKQKRIDAYQDHRLIFEENKEKGGYTLRQGPDPIYDADFVELIDDPSLTRFWTQERNRDYAFWIGTGVVGVPLGGMLFYNNFLGEGPLAVFRSPSAEQKVNAGDWRTFGLSLLGVAMASYGLYNLSLWAMEELDLRHPDRLDKDSIAPRVRDFNEDLRQRLNLEPSEIPSPPTPRPSELPSGEPSPGASGVPSGAASGIPTANPQAPAEMFDTAPHALPDAYPQGHPPEAVPMPLPVITPGSVPSGLISPKPRPTDFNFPGQSPFPSPVPSPSAS